MLLLAAFAYLFPSGSLPPDATVCERLDFLLFLFLEHSLLMLLVIWVKVGEANFIGLEQPAKTFQVEVLILHPVTQGSKFPLPYHFNMWL